MRSFLSIGMCARATTTSITTTATRGILSTLFGEQGGKGKGSGGETVVVVPPMSVVSDAAGMGSATFPSGVDASKGAFIGNFPATDAALDASNFHNNVPVVRDTDSVVEVSKLLAKYDVGCVPVLDKDSRLVGMVSERDLARWIGRTSSQPPAGTTTSTTITLPQTTTQDIMSKQVIKCHVDTALSEALRLMYKHNFRHLPIVAAHDDKEVVGLLSMRDIITLEQRGKDADESDVDDFMKWVLRMSS